MSPLHWLPRSLPAMWVVLTAATIGAASGQTVMLPTDVGGWTRTDSVRIYPGRNLYLLVDGGADLFYEYGFLQAFSAGYALPPGGDATVELYEMRDAGAAYGVFTAFSAGTGLRAPVGQEAILGDGYCLFWKGAHVGMITAGSADSASAPSILQLAEGIAKSIGDTGVVPDLCSFLWRGGLNRREMVYIRGKLALADQIPQAWAAAFPPTEGVVGTAGRSQYLVLRYADAPGARAALDIAEEKWVVSSTIPVGDPSRGWLIRGENGTRVQVVRQDRYLISVAGAEEESDSLANLLRRLLEDLLNTGSGASPDHHSSSYTASSHPFSYSRRQRADAPASSSG